MENSNIEHILMQSLPLDEVHVINDDNGHFTIFAIGEIFSELSNLKKQQIIYEPLMEDILNKNIHAISIKSFSPIEWINNKKLFGF